MDGDEGQWREEAWMVGVKAGECMNEASCEKNGADYFSLSLHQAAYGFPKRILHGHNDFVSDVTMSSDGQFALSSSWDKTLRYVSIELFLGKMS